MGCSGKSWACGEDALRGWDECRWDGPWLGTPPIVEDDSMSPSYLYPQRRPDCRISASCSRWRIQPLALTALPTQLV